MQSPAIALLQIILFANFDLLTGLNGYQQQNSQNNPLFLEGVNVNASYIPPTLNVTKSGFSFLPKLEPIKQAAQSFSTIPQLEEQQFTPSALIAEQKFTPQQQYITQKDYISQQQYVRQNEFNPYHQYTPQNPFAAQTAYNPNQQQYSPHQSIFFPSSPYLPQQQFYQNRNPNYNGAQPSLQNPFGNPYQQSGLPKMPPIFIDAAIGPTLYNAPMYMKRRTIQEICSAIAPEERTIIYVLSQSPEFGLNNIELPPPTKPTKPEVVFIKYKTPEEAELVQRQIQAQYDALEGTSEITDESIGRVNSVEKFLQSANNSAINLSNGGY